MISLLISPNPNDRLRGRYHCQPSTKRSGEGWHNTFLLAVINSKFDFALKGFPMPSRRKIRPEGKELSTTKKDAPDSAGQQKMKIRGVVCACAYFPLTWR
jgi:hypothetical protein